MFNILHDQELSGRSFQRGNAVAHRYEVNLSQLFCRIPENLCLHGLLVMAMPAVAIAQTAMPTSTTADPNSEIQEVVVTGSHITQSGFDTPTPVTMIEPGKLVGMSPTLADTLDTLPSLKASNGPVQTTVGTAGSGQAFLNLRSLGPQRTLVLLDGRRLVPADGSGPSDVDMIPNLLVQRVDLVTGGASAAYGSDAVAGVVNFILDKKYTGIKIQAESGISDYGDAAERQFSAAFGSGFAGNRGHIIASLEAFNNNGLVNTDRPWASDGANIIPSASGTPKFLITRGATIANGSYGGLIVSGPLKGTTFGPGGVPEAFQYGTQVTASSMIGGDGPKASGGDRWGLTSPLERENLFAHAEFEIASEVTAFAETMVGWTRTSSAGADSYALGSLALNIRKDNAFLPQSIVNRMSTAGINSFALGRVLGDVPGFATKTQSTTTNFLTGINFPVANWTGGLYLQRGEDREAVQNPNLNQINFYQAVDAVVSPTTGQPVCRSTLTNPNNGCVPFDVFGAGSASANAIKYVTGDGDYSVLHSIQNDIALNIQGKPFKLPAGPFSVAAGIEYRDQSLDQSVDPLSLEFNPITNSFGAWRAGNPKPISASRNVKEGYIELLAPLLTDLPFARSLDVDVAGRRTSYSTSGDVTTWKVGVNYKPFDQVRLRLTRSRDIEAPSLNQLYQSGAQTTAVAFDPLKGVEVSGLKGFSVGNTSLVPEKADTWTYGIVYSPTYISGLNLSVDIFDITVDGAITTLAAQQILDQCAAGAAALCNAELRDANGNLTGINIQPFNLQTLKTSGADIEGSYRTALGDVASSWSGELTVRALATYVNHLTQTTAGSTVEYAGQLDALDATALPHWRGLLEVTYDKDPFALLLQTRVVGGGKYMNAYVEGVTINDNSIGAQAYLDARISYKAPIFSGRWQAYLSVSNLLNTDPPLDPGNFSAPFATNTYLYDVLGRMYRIGISAEL
jgi:outer membrane receptor protein involved in Fe transport